MDWIQMAQDQILCTQRLTSESHKVRGITWADERQYVLKHDSSLMSTSHYYNISTQPALIY
jgi:hypothetical protein